MKIKLIAAHFMTHNRQRSKNDCRSKCAALHDGDGNGNKGNGSGNYERSGLEEGGPMDWCTTSCDGRNTVFESIAIDDGYLVYTFAEASSVRAKLIRCSN